MAEENNPDQGKSDKISSQKKMAKKRIRDNLKSLGEKNSVSSYLLFIDDNEDIMTFSSDGYGPLESFLKNLPAMQIVNAEVAAYVKNENEVRKTLRLLKMINDEEADAEAKRLADQANEAAAYNVGHHEEQENLIVPELDGQFQPVNLNLEIVPPQEVEGAVAAAHNLDASGFDVAGTEGDDGEAEKATPPTITEAADVSLGLVQADNADLRLELEDEPVEELFIIKKRKTQDTSALRKSTRITDVKQRKAASRGYFARGRGQVRTRGGTLRERE